ncbi:ATP-binding protein [Streptomyces sp. NPDC055060]
MAATAAPPVATGALGVSSYSAQLPCQPEAVSRARTFVSESLDTWNLAEELADIGELIVSELMANVVSHTKTDLTTVSLRRGKRRVRIEVADSSCTTPQVGFADGNSDHGRGLVLIDALSSHWGYVKYPWGKIVWAEMSVSEQ